MKKKLLLLATAVAYASIAQAQPVIGGILNAVSNIRPGLPGSGIAQGSWMAIYGTGLGPAEGAESGLPRPTAAGFMGTRVRVTAGATTYESPITFTRADQVNAIMPSNVPIGQATVVVLYNGQQSSPFPVSVVRFAPGIVTQSFGVGPAKISNASNNYQEVTYATAINPGEVGIIWATGLGAVTPAEDISGAVGPIPNAAQVEVFIGGRLATVQYSGRAPGATAGDQINFVAPDVEGCAVPIVVRVNGGLGVTSNFSSISIARSGRICRDRGFTEADFQSAANGNLRFGTLSLGRTTIKSSAQGFEILSRTDIASGGFFRFDFNTLIRSSSVAQPPPGACTVSTYGANPGTDPAFATITPLDAGNPLGLNGPNGAKQVPRTTPGFYSAQVGGGTTISGLPPGIPNPFPPGMPDYFTVGEHTMTGPGGADVGAFTARINMPAALTWTNEAATTAVNRTQDLRVTWSGGAANDLVVINGSSTSTSPTAGGSFTCYSVASAGAFTVPSWVLSALPISSGGTASPTGILLIGNTSLEPTRFTASGVDIGIIQYFNTSGKNLPYQ